MAEESKKKTTAKKKSTDEKVTPKKANELRTEVEAKQKKAGKAPKTTSANKTAEKKPKSPSAKKTDKKVEAAFEQAAPQKRATSKKKAEPAKEVKAVEAKTEVKATKRKSARGSKNVAEVLAAEEQVQVEAAQAPAEKKPARKGRPPKKAAEAKAAEQTASDKKPTRRGRPPKKAAEAKAVEETAPVEATPAEEAPAEETPVEAAAPAEQKPAEKKTSSKRRDERPEKSVPRHLAPSAVIQRGEEWLAGLFERMNLALSATGELRGGDLNFDIAGDDVDGFLGRANASPRALESIQTLLTETLGSITDKRVVVDVGGFRQKRQDRLAEVATKLGEAAKKISRTVTVAGLNSFERRVIHQKLDDIGGVKTESTDAGIFRKLKINPKS